MTEPNDTTAAAGAGAMAEEIARLRARVEALLAGGEAAPTMAEVADRAGAAGEALGRALAREAGALADAARQRPLAALALAALAGFALGRLLARAGRG